MRATTKKMPDLLVVTAILFNVAVFIALYEGAVRLLS